MKGLRGLVRVKLDVAPDGTLTGCHVSQRTSPDQFADHTCALITKRASFTPALDARGAPVASYMMLTFRWGT
jgi:TonB family protein